MNKNEELTLLKVADLFVKYIVLKTEDTVLEVEAAEVSEDLARLIMKKKHLG